MFHYPWKCRGCGNEIEVERTTMNDSSKEPEQDCECGAKEWYRIIGKTTFVLQGGGWYKDSYEKR